MILLTHIHVFTNSDAYISSYINIEFLKYQYLFVLNPRVEDLNARDLALADVGKGPKNKTTKIKLDSLGGIKAWSGLANS